MAAEALTQLRTPAPRASAFAGKCFVGPVFDYLLIGGGLSLPVLALVLGAREWLGLDAVASRPDALTGPVAIGWVVLLCNGAHFAASTVRLYTKPGSVEKLPFVTLVLPLLALGLLTLGLFSVDRLGRHLVSLYLTWSPYHYAAQAYGLAVMYCYRSGFAIDGRRKRTLRWLSLLPFAHSFLLTPGLGIQWLLPAALFEGLPLAVGHIVIAPLLIAGGLLGPVLLWLSLSSRPQPMPLIAPLLLIVNGVWWYLLPPLEAFIWATFFHGIQYLAIVLIFHAREQVALPGNRASRRSHALRFYAACVVLAYALFNCLPQAYVLLGLTVTESLILVASMVNIHHFIVDGFIWRLGRQDSNRSVVDASAARAMSAGA